MNITLRLAVERDHQGLGEVMFDAVRNGKSKYSESQRAAWVPEPRCGPDWTSRLARQQIIVAETGDRLVGFMSLASGGYIDFAYIRPEAQGRGLFRRLYERIEELAKHGGEPLLWVHASLVAQPAFSAVGFSIRKEEVVKIGEEKFERFEMEKHLQLTLN